MRYRKLHPVTADHRREINIRYLAKHAAFWRPMRFPFQGIEKHPALRSIPIIAVTFSGEEKKARAAGCDG